MEEEDGGGGWEDGGEGWRWGGVEDGGGGWRRGGGERGVLKQEVCPASLHPEGA